MRIVVVGAGKVGRVLTEQLAAEKHDIVVIDQDSDLIESLVNIYDVRGVAGNGGCYDIQKDAFEDGADLLIATTSSDETNILACLVAKKLGTPHTIARIRNPEYEKQLHFMREELGLSMVVNPEKATAREIARVLRFPSAIKREQFCRQRFELVEYRINEGNPLVGLQLSDLYRNIRVKILICAVARGQQTIIPTGATVLQKGDKIYLTASARELESFFRKLNIFKARANNIMIVGASRITYYLVKELQDIQKRVTVIDSNAARCQAMSEKFPGALVIHGDGADSELLSEERISEMDAFVPLTGLDETNIILPCTPASLPTARWWPRSTAPALPTWPTRKAWWTAWFPPPPSPAKSLPGMCVRCKIVLTLTTSRPCTAWWAAASKRWSSTSAPACLSSVYR